MLQETGECLKTVEGRDRWDGMGSLEKMGAAALGTAWVKLASVAPPLPFYYNTKIKERK